VATRTSVQQRVSSTSSSTPKATQSTSPEEHHDGGRTSNFSRKSINIDLRKASDQVSATMGAFVLSSTCTIHGAAASLRVCVAICAPLSHMSHIIRSTFHQPYRLAPTTRALQRTHWCKRRRQQCMRCLAKLGRRVSAQVVSHRARMSYYCTRSENAGGRYIAACPWAGPCDSCTWRFVKCITSISCQGPPRS
jgi:hypothetical protein